MIDGKQGERIDQMFDIGLKFDGSCFNSDDGMISVSHLDTFCYDDEKWDKMIEDLKKYLIDVKADIELDQIIRQTIQEEIGETDNDRFSN